MYERKGKRCTEVYGVRKDTVTPVCDDDWDDPGSRRIGDLSPLVM